MGTKTCPPNHVWCENEFHLGWDTFSTTTSSVSLELYIVASGSVNDYTEAVLKDLRKKIADMLAIKKKLVTVTVGAGSVIITATIAVPAATAAAAQATVSSNLGTAAAASTALGITVEAAPTITITGSAPPPPSSDDGGLPTGVIIGIAVGGGVGLLLLVGVTVYCMKKGGKKIVNPV